MRRERGFPEGIHGVMLLQRSGGRTRLGWWTVLTGLSCYCIYLCSNVLMLYLSQPTTSASKIAAPVINKALYCPDAWVNPEGGIDAGYDASLQAFVHSFKWYPPEIDAVILWKQAHYMHEDFPAKNVSIRQAMMDISYEPADVIADVKVSPSSGAFGSLKYDVFRQAHSTGICYLIVIKSKLSPLASMLRQYTVVVNHHQNFVAGNDGPWRAMKMKDVWQFETIGGRLAYGGLAYAYSGTNIGITIHQYTRTITPTQRTPCKEYNTQDEFATCCLRKFDRLCELSEGGNLYIPEIREWLEGTSTTGKTVSLALPCHRSDPNIVRKIDRCITPCTMDSWPITRVASYGKSNKTFAVKISLSNNLWSERQDQRISLGLETLISVLGGLISLYLGASLVAVAEMGIAVLEKIVAFREDAQVGCG